MKKCFLFTALILGASLLLGGCSNFLGADASAREKLAAELAYAKAKEIKINLYAEVEDSSKITLTTVVTSAKQGYPFQVKYKIDAEKYFVDGAKLSSGGKVLEAEKDYKFVPGEGNDFEITILNGYDSVDVVPNVVNYPLIYLDKPRLEDKDTGDTVGMARCNMVSTESENFIIGKKYGISYALNDGNGYAVSKMFFEKDGTELTDEQLKEYFDIETIKPGEKNITVKSIKADGVHIKALAVVSEGEQTDLSGPKISGGENALKFGSVVMPVKKFQSSTSDSDYPELERDDTVTITLSKGDEKEIAKYKVVERVMKLTSGMAVQISDRSWIDTDVTGAVRLFTDSLIFSNDSDFNKNDYYKEYEISETSNVITLKTSVEKGGIHQWHISAVGKDGAQSPDPFVFTAKIKKSIEGDIRMVREVVNKATGFTSNFVFKDLSGNNPFSTDETAQKLLECRIGSYVKSDGTTLISASGIIKDVYNLNNTPPDKYAMALHNTMKDYPKEFSGSSSATVKFSKPLARGKKYECQVYLLDKYGNKICYSQDYGLTQKADFLDIAVGQLNFSDSVPNIAFMSYEEFEEYYSHGGSLQSFGIVVYVSDATRELIVMAPTETPKITDYYPNINPSMSFGSGTGRKYTWQTSGEKICSDFRTDQNETAPNPVIACIRYTSPHQNNKKNIQWFIPAWQDCNRYFKDTTAVYNSIDAQIEKMIALEPHVWVKLRISGSALDYWCSNANNQSSTLNYSKAYYMNPTSSSSAECSLSNYHYARCFVNLYDRDTVN